jgi:hypothetical protein
MKRILTALALAVSVVACSDSNPAPAPSPTPAPPATTPTLQSVSLSAPASSLTRAGATAQITATGTLSNGTTQNITSTCSGWQSSNTVVLTVSASGLITAQGSGVANVSAACQGILASGSVTVTLTAPPTPTTLTLNGHVTDGTSGGVLPNINMQITTGPNVGKAVRTDGSGNYSLDGLSSGAYALEASAAGYVTQSKTGTLTASLRIDFVLQRVSAPAPAPAPSPTPSPAPGGTPNVEYRITGTARRCDATYENSTGGVNQATVSIPFSYSWNGARAGDFLYMSCQISTGGDTGNITVTIYKNGNFYRSGMAIGFPNIATASGSY